jgi:hypothetical protein
MGDGLQLNVGGRTMSRTPARPQSTHQLIEQITKEALRNAALAPTYQDALDVTGDALRRLAELAKMEVHHA